MHTMYCICFVFLCCAKVRPILTLTTLGTLERRRRKIRPKTIWVRFVFLFCAKAKSGAARTYLDAQKEDKVILEDEVISKLIYLSI